VTLATTVPEIPESAVDFGLALDFADGRALSLVARENDQSYV
jgi:hypothetical protein